jgi:hypothetical protein
MVSGLQLEDLDLYDLSFEQVSHCISNVDSMSVEYACLVAILTNISLYDKYPWLARLFLEFHSKYPSISASCILDFKVALLDRLGDVYCIQILLSMLLTDLSVFGNVLATSFERIVGFISHEVCLLIRMLSFQHALHALHSIHVQMNNFCCK